MGEVLSPPAFCPPCNIQSFMANNRWASFFQFSSFSNFLQRIVGHHFYMFPTCPIFCKESTGYPALDPTANKYISGSGWEMFCFVLCLFVCLFLCFSLSCYVVLNVCICVLLVCKCKNLKKTRRKQTKHKET